MTGSTADLSAAGSPAQPEVSTQPDVVARARAILARYDPDGRLPRCDLKSVVIGGDVLGQVVPLVEQLTAGVQRPEVALVVDPVRIDRAGVDIKADLEHALAQRFSVRRVVADDGHPELHATEDVIGAATEAVRGVDIVVSIGGGTVTDVGKMAARQAGIPAVLAVATAASVDGFTDDVSVLLRNGVKRTVPSRWPDIVLADIGVVAQAPSAMNAAGYGEINSMFTAPADWKLAQLAGIDDSFHDAPIRILDEVGAGIEEWSAGVGRDRDATEKLMTALALRGIATGVAGSTACLSGVEHLISHMLDLWHGQRHQPIGLHGAQVGVASVVAAVVWQTLLERLGEGSPPDIAAGIDAIDLDQQRQRVTDAFSAADPSGRIGAECWADYERKLAAIGAARDSLVALIAGWSDHAEELRALGRTAEQIATGLVAAGAPAWFDDLGVDGELASWTVTHTAKMRNRFTAVDLLDLLGWWTDADVARVLDRSLQVVTDARGAARGRA